MIAHKGEQAVTVRALRGAAPYIHMYKGKVFVIKAGGGAFRDAHVPITAVFTAGAVTMALCVALLWKVRTPTASSSAPSPSPS